MYLGFYTIHLKGERSKKCTWEQQTKEINRGLCNSNFHFSYSSVCAYMYTENTTNLLFAYWKYSQHLALRCHFILQSNPINSQSDKLRFITFKILLSKKASQIQNIISQTPDNSNYFFQVALLKNGTSKNLDEYTVSEDIQPFMVQASHPYIK